MHPVPACPLDDVIVETPVGPSGREKDQTDAFLALSQTLASQPASAIQRLVDAAMRLTGSGSAGVSLVDESGDEPVFRWVATAGEYARYVNGTMPRDFSPCGTVLQRGRALVMDKPDRHWAYMSELLHAPIETVLLVPFARRGKLVGTVWVVRHEPGHAFTGKDVKTVEELTTFATAILDAIERNGPAARAAT